MNVLVLNPNTTAAMTALVCQRLRLAVPAGTTLQALTASAGPDVIATRQAFNAAGATAAAMLGQALAARGTQHAPWQAVVLACFGDPGLEQLQGLDGVPVIGLAQASMRAAERTGERYAIVTAGAPWKDLLEQRFAQWGASPRFAGVQVLQGTGLAVLRDPAGMLPAVGAALAGAARAGASRVILGGAAFAGYKEFMARRGHATTGLLDCVEAAAQELAGQGQ